MPGGVVELGERLEAAIIREVEEETGLHVRPFQVVEVLDSIVRQGGGASGFSSERRPEEAARVRFHYVLIDYLCGVEGGELGSSSDASEVCWLAVDSLREHGEFALQSRTIEVIAKAVAMTGGPPAS